MDYGVRAEVDWMVKVSERALVNATLPFEAHEQCG